jgi:penicillin-binding protein 1A
MLRLISITLSLVVLMAMLAGAGILWIFWTYGKGLPDYQQLANYEPPVVTRVHAGNGALLAEYASEKRLFVPVEAIPSRLIQAFISAEDKAFYDHFGVDLRALVRAVITNIVNYGSGRRPVGASTITQQVTKNFLLNNEVSIDRKIKEAILSLRMERAFTKDQILALYLNEIYLGRGSYGVAAAALKYFDKSLDQLDLQEMAYLAALPKAPNNYHPIHNRRAATVRRNWVLREMQQNGYISQDEAALAKDMPLQISGQSGFDGADAPYFTEEVRRQLIRQFGESSLYDGGLSVRTTLDPFLQQVADNALEHGLEALDRRQGWRGPLDVLKDGADVDKVLAEHTKKLRPNHYAALVIEVGRRSAKIYVAGRQAVIPFE